MFVTTENEQISLPSLHANDSLMSSPMESNPDSPSFPAVFTDVNVVPEHEKGELSQSVSNLEGEIARLRLQRRIWNNKRREALNKIIDIKGSIRVFCRVRPFLDTERRRIREPVSAGSEKVVVKNGGNRKEFEFDKAFHQEASQDEVFVEVEPILRSSLDGHNVCILAYGQTGTGKTFTMDGTSEQPGIIPRALKELFVQASSEGESLTFSMSMLEVYMGSIRDLLAPRPTCRAYEAITRCNLNIQTDPKGSIEIEGLTEVEIQDYAKARWWYNRGRRARSTSWTNVNEASSRSHCLLRITIFRAGSGSEAKSLVSKLWMVDLGGSERLLKTGASGLTHDEGRAINLSLSALGDVVAALRRKRGHVPYRNSKLTQILKDSLGDGSKVLMLVHVSPCEDDVGETICSLCFAKRARAVESNREQTEDLRKQKEKRIRELEEHMREAELECEKVKNRIQKSELLLSETKKLYLDADQPQENDDQNALETPRADTKESVETPRATDKPSRGITRKSLPRFMTSTVASRERQTASEKTVADRTRNLQVRSVTRISVNFAASQSISFSDRRFKAALRNTNRRSLAEVKIVEAVIADTSDSLKCNDGSDTKSTSLSKSKLVTSSDPNFRATISRHRRRMSDLI